MCLGEKSYSNISTSEWFQACVFSTIHTLCVFYGLCITYNVEFFFLSTPLLVCRDYSVVAPSFPLRPFTGSLSVSLICSLPFSLPLSPHHALFVSLVDTSLTLIQRLVIAVRCSCADFHSALYTDSTNLNLVGKLRALSHNVLCICCNTMLSAVDSCVCLYLCVCLLCYYYVL